MEPVVFRTGNSLSDRLLAAIAEGRYTDGDVRQLLDKLPDALVRDYIRDKVSLDAGITYALKLAQRRAAEMVDEAWAVEDEEQVDLQGNPVPSASKDNPGKEKCIKLLNAANDRLIKYGEKILMIDRQRLIQQTIEEVVMDFLTPEQWDRFCAVMDAKMYDLGQ